MLTAICVMPVDPVRFHLPELRNVRVVQWARILVQVLPVKLALRARPTLIHAPQPDSAVLLAILLTAVSPIPMYALNVPWAQHLLKTVLRVPDVPLAVTSTIILVLCAMLVNIL